jgi:hypothetical protein
MNERLSIIKVAHCVCPLGLYTMLSKTGSRFKGLECRVFQRHCVAQDQTKTSLGNVYVFR